MVTEIANAKINLYLDVTSIRDDGFHNIKSIMHTISLSDKLTFEIIPSDETCVKIRHNSTELKNDNSNLIYKSASKYLSYFKVNARVFVELEKNIPIGAGLGGGSADAAATLRALNGVFKLATKEELLKLAAEIGSDVPFCLMGGIAFCEGRGEILTQLKESPSLCLAVAIGEGRVSTPEAYKLLDCKFDYCFDDCKRSLSDKGYFNIFEEVIFSDEISKIKDILTKNGAEVAMMSGSGPSVFGVFKNESEALGAVDVLKKHGFNAYYATSQPVRYIDYDL